MIYNEDGDLKYIGGMKKGMHSGYGKGFHTNGCAFLEGTFLKGKLHGEKCNIYSTQGMLLFEGGMKHGTPHGLCKEFDEQGRVLSMANHSGGQFLRQNIMVSNYETRSMNNLSKKK